MNPGDKITVHMFDGAIPGGHALEIREQDLTTGRSGFMIASAANRFMNTNPFDCTGTPFNFEPEYATASAQNIVPWGIGPYMINSQYEIGHWEACTTVSGAATDTIGSFTDTYYKHCQGPYETSADNSKDNEPDDSPCYRKGDTHGGTAAPNLVTGCDVFFDAIGDLDYDGQPYWPDWPDSTTAGPFPTSFLQQQPTSTGHVYPQIQFMTDSSATQFNTNCNLTSGAGCQLPPKGPATSTHTSLWRRSAANARGSSATWPTARPSAVTRSTDRSARRRWVPLRDQSAGIRAADRTQSSRQIDGSIRGRDEGGAQVRPVGRRSASGSGSPESSLAPLDPILRC